MQLNGDTRGARLLRNIVRLYTRRCPYGRGKQRLFRAFHTFWSAPELPQQVKLSDGCLMECDLHEFIQRHIYYLGCYDSASVAVMKRYLQPGMVVVDGGANVGQFTLVAAEAVGLVGEVHAFEPAPNNFAALSRNVALNRFTEVYLNRMALADKEIDNQVFYLSQDDNMGAHSLKPTTTKLSEASFSVAVTTLDSYFAERDKLPAFIKLDVEGAELPILLGARQTIETARPWLIVEASAETAHAFGYTLRELTDQLEQWNYRLYRIEASGNLIPVATTTLEKPFFNMFCEPSR